MRLTDAHATAEVDPLPGLPVLLPVFEVLFHPLDCSHGAGWVGVRVEVGEGVAFHAFGEAAAFFKGSDTGIAAHQLPFALFVLLLAFGSARVVVPLTGLAVFPLQGWRKLDPLDLQIPVTVRADVVVELECVARRGSPLPTRRRTTCNLPSVGQQVFDRLHPSPPPPASIPESSKRLRAWPRSPRRASSVGPSRSAPRRPRSLPHARPTAPGCSLRTPPSLRPAR